MIEGEAVVGRFGSKDRLLSLTSLATAIARTINGKSAEIISRSLSNPRALPRYSFGRREGPPLALSAACHNMRAVEENSIGSVTGDKSAGHDGMSHLVHLRLAHAEAIGLLDHAL
jgi:hypothetical protein